MRGGKREGAGRKKGSATLRTREIANAAAEQGITPLEVMLGAMRKAWDEGDRAAAANFAKDAAPYIHPKLSNVQHSGDADNPVETVTRIELTSPDGHSTDRTAAETHPHIHRPS